MRRGFTIIEILIAMLILFMAIIFVNMSIKAFNSYQRKAEIYQNFYITALSLKDWVEVQDLGNKKSYNGVLNGINYNINIDIVAKMRNYIVYTEGGGMGSNSGNFYIILYRLRMTLKSDIRAKEYSFYLTKQKITNPYSEFDEVAK
jgi:prepilin-type N-terminal cleavage/methylation domain-containing protein